MTKYQFDLNCYHGPLFRRIVLALKAGIDSGQLAADSKLPTHRSLAQTLGVTVGTVSRAYAEAEKQGLIYAKVGAGSFVRGSATGHRWKIEALENPQPIHLTNSMPMPIKRTASIKHALNALTQWDDDEFESLLDYGDTQGSFNTRQLVCDWQQRRGVSLSPQRLLFTHGVHHGLTLALLCSAQQSVLLTDELTYPGILQLAESLNIAVKGVTSDGDGIDLVKLKHACEHYQPAALYLTPSLHNPTCTNLSREKRLAILTICQEYGVWVIEDDTANMQRPDDNHHIEPMVNLAPEQVIYLSGLSKVVCAGLRVAWLQAPQALMSKVTRAMISTSWMVSPINVAIAHELIDSGQAEHIIELQHQAWQQRALLVQQKLAGFDYRFALGSFFVWLPLPQGWQASRFVSLCEQQGIRVLASDVFSAPNCRPPAAVRLAISQPKNDVTLAQALDVIVHLLKQNPLSIHW